MITKLLCIIITMLLDNYEDIMHNITKLSLDILNTFRAKIHNIDINCFKNNRGSTF